MGKNKKIKILLWIITIILIIFQVITISIAITKQYYLIYDWIFYIINYIIITLMFMLINSNNTVVKLFKVVIAVVLLVINTTTFYRMGNTNIIISKSNDKKHELIIKEYPTMNFSSMRLKRRGVIFGKKVDTLENSAFYKTIENKSYKINWASDDNAVLTYKINENDLTQEVYNFRSTGDNGYYYVLPALNGKWVNKDADNKYFLNTGEKIVYSDGENLYYYEINDTTQHGVLAITLRKTNNPTISIVLNSDSKIDSSGIAKNDSSITIIKESLKNEKPQVYYKE